MFISMQIATALKVPSSICFSCTEAWLYCHLDSSAGRAPDCVASRGPKRAHTLISKSRVSSSRCCGLALSLNFLIKHLPLVRIVQEKLLHVCNTPVTLNECRMYVGEIHENKAHMYRPVNQLPL